MIGISGGLLPKYYLNDILPVLTALWSVIHYLIPDIIHDTPLVGFVFGGCLIIRAV